jgi:YceI-like domain
MKYSIEDGSFNVTGNLTLHGVTKAGALAAHFVNSEVNPITKAYTVGFEASTVIKRGDFGISKYLPMLGDDVRLKIAGAFEMQSQCAWHKHSSRLAGSVRCPVRFKPRVQESLMPGDLAFPETIPKLFPGRDRICLVDDHLGYEWPP